MIGDIRAGFHWEGGVRIDLDTGRYEAHACAWVGIEEEVERAVKDGKPPNRCFDLNPKQDFATVEEAQAAYDERIKPLKQTMMDTLSSKS